MISLENIQKYVDDRLNENLILSYDTRIIDLTFDSLELLELISYMEKSFLVEINLSEINNQMSLREFIELINNKIEKPNP
jgi:acyl carrier protein